MHKWKVVYFLIDKAQEPSSLKKMGVQGWLLQERNEIWGVGDQLGFHKEIPETEIKMAKRTINMMLESKALRKNETIPCFG